MVMAGAANSALNVSVTIPFENNEAAEMVKSILNVDKQFKDCSTKRDISTDGQYLLAKFDSTDLRRLRVVVTSFFKQVFLIAKTIEQFS